MGILTSVLLEHQAVLWRLAVNLVVHKEICDHRSAIDHDGSTAIAIGLCDEADAPADRRPVVEDGPAN